ncbi:MAG: ParA family protein [Bacteroidota bacterium]
MVIAVTHPFDKKTKSKTSLYLARKLAENGNSVLLIDLASDCFITRELGYQNLTRTITDVMDGSIKLDDIILRHGNFAFASANCALKLIDISLAWTRERNRWLQRALDRLEIEFDTIIIDCDSSLSFLTLNALTACDIALLPTFSEQNPKETSAAIHLLGCEEIMQQKAQLISNCENVFAQLSEQFNRGSKLLLLDQPIWTQDYLLPELAVIKKEDFTPAVTEQIRDFTIYLN